MLMRIHNTEKINDLVEYINNPGSISLIRILVGDKDTAVVPAEYGVWSPGLCISIKDIHCRNLRT